MTEEVKPKRGRGRPPKAPNKVNMQKLIKKAPTLEEIATGSKSLFEESFNVLVQIMNAQGDFEEATHQIRYQAAKEVNKLCYSMFEEQLKEIIAQAEKDGLTEEQLEAEAKKVEEEPEVRSENVFTLKTFKG